MDNSGINGIVEIVKMIDGSAFEITAEEYRSILGKSGIFYFPSCGRTINSNSLSQIMSKKDYEIDKMLEKKRSQKEGVLHDGTYAYKLFGEWAYDYDVTRYIISDPINMGYPEVARDCVPTKLEWETKYKYIENKKTRLQAILQNFEMVVAPRDGEIKSLNDSLKNYETKRIGSPEN